MLPYREYIIDNLKQELTREEEFLKSQLLNIHLHEASMTEEQAENHPLLQELRGSYIVRAEKLVQKRVQL
jgi:hypothetical protein